MYSVLNVNVNSFLCNKLINSTDHKVNKENKKNNKKIYN